MRLGRFAWVAVLACGTAVAYGVYAPEAADRWLPAAGGLAHQLHDRIWSSPPQTASAPGQAQQSQTTGPAPIVVTVTSVKRADFPVVLQSIGQVQAYNTVLVRARVDGQIMKIAFNEGQMVKQGDLLAQIDPRPFQAALDQAVAKKAQDEANLANAKLDLTRFATLAKQDFATKQQLDTQNALVLQLTASIAAPPPTPRGRSSTIRPSAPPSRAARGSGSSTRVISSMPDSRPASCRSRNCNRSPSFSLNRRNT
jgi:multidrug efflux pump subunit AcrA (membrane-fusion protein)